MSDLSDASLQTRILDVSKRMGTRTFLRLLAADGVTIEMTYATLLQQAGIWAGVFSANKLGPRSRVILLLSHSADLYAAFLGALLSDHIPAILAPPSPKLSPERFGEMLQGILPGTSPDAIVVGSELSVDISIAANVKVIRTADAMAAFSPQLLTITTADRKDDIAFLQYSSGTTGLKKGVAITHGACLRQVDRYAATLGLSATDSIISWLPLYHDMGFIACWLMPLLTGTPITAMSAFDWIARPSSLIRAIRDHRPTLCWMPNFAFAHLARIGAGPDSRPDDLSSLRALINCSEPIQNATLERFVEVFAAAGMCGEKLATCYAMAETTFAVTSSEIGSAPKAIGVDPATLAPGQSVGPGQTRIVSSGRPIADTTVRIADPEGRSLANGTIGEIRIRSASAMLGYLTNAELRAGTLEDGELATGDLAFIWNDELFVLGRGDDLIVTAGRNLFPQDIEAAAETVRGTIPGRSVAFGIPDDRSGTTHVIVVAESTLTEEQDRIALERAIAAEIVAKLDMAPGAVKVVERGRLLKSTSGKLSRRANRDAYVREFQAAAKPAATTAPASTDPLLDFVRASVMRALDGELPDDDDSLILSGRLDSLALMSLLLDLEHRFGDRVPTPNIIGFHRYDSIRNLAELLMEVEEGLQIQSRDMTYAARDIKIDAIERANTPIDLLILGSSTSFALPCSVAEEFGFSAFNLAVNSASVADIYCLMRFAQAHLPAIRRLIVGLDIFAFKDRGDDALDARSILLPKVTQYLFPEDRTALSDLDGEALSRLQHQQIHRQRLAEWNPRMWFSFDRRTGDLIVNAGPGGIGASAASLQEVAGQQQELFMIFNGFEQLCEKQSRYLRAIADAASEANTFIDFVIMPLHPLIQDFVVNKTQYPSRHADIRALFASLNVPNLRLHDFASPSAFGGDDNDFVDAYHIGPVNAERLMRVVLAG